MGKYGVILYIMPSLSKSLGEAIGTNKNTKSTKLTEAFPIHRKERGTYAVPKKFAVIQADLMYIKTEKKGYNYILNVVDVASRAVDAVPLRGRTSEDVIEGFEQIWKRKHIDFDLVEYVYCDPGAEFKNSNFRDYMDDLGIVVRYTMTARKNQNSIVEAYNGILAKQLGKKIASEELRTGKAYNDWGKDLKKNGDSYEPKRTLEGAKGFRLF